MTLQPYQKHQARHPWLTAALFIAMFIPAILLVVALALGLKQLASEPRFWQIALATPLVVLVFAGGMLIGALIFLVVMKRFVQREDLEPFYIYPGVPVASDLSAKLFRWAYRHDEMT